MNIAFVTNGLSIGGAQQYVITKAEWLINRGYNVIVVSEGGVWEDKLPKGVNHYRLKGIKSSPYGFKNDEYNSLKHDLAKILIDNNVDIVEGHNTWPIIHVMNSYGIHRKKYYMNILGELSYRRNPLLQIATKLLNKEHLYFTLTAKMNRYIQKKCGAKLSPVIIKIPVKCSQNINCTDGRFILSVCRMSPEKMYVKALMEGFKKLVSKNKEIKHDLILVGDGPLFDEVVDMANIINQELGQKRIILKGFVEGKALINLYSSCSVYVGMGTTLLTAASMAKPCVKCGFEPSTMEKAWGFFGDNPDSDKDELVYSSFNSATYESYENILLRILSDSNLRKEMGDKAQELFLKNYSFEDTMKKWEDNYRKIMYNDKINWWKIYRKTQFSTSILYHIYKLYSLKKYLMR